MKKYIGKIYWVKAKFVEVELLPNESAQRVEYSFLENIIVEENHIQFETESYESEENTALSTPYLVNLKSSNHQSSNYQGGYSKKENNTLISDSIICELFTNQKGKVLHGQWNEKKKTYLFWVHLFEIT